MQDSLRQKFEEFEEKDKWGDEFNKLKNQTTYKSLTLKVAKSMDNFRKNRYRDVLPYDHTRIKLGGPSDSDYINASIVEIAGTGREHILTQGPLQSTSRDFWQMMWEQNSKAVIMLNRVIEKNTIKCHQYFPEKNGEEMPEPMKFDGRQPTFEVTLLEENPTEHYVIRKLDLHNLETGEHREVAHYQFVTWPDFGVPESSSDFLEFLHKVRADGCLNRNEFGPPIIHCSAGIGRSGTFIIVDAALVTAKTKGVQHVDIMKTVKELRKSRMGLIQTPDQLRFCWLTVLDALEKEEWAELFNTGLYPIEKADFIHSPIESKTLKRPSVSIEAEGPAFEAAIPSPEKENQEYGTGATTPQGESPYKRKKNSEMETPSPLPPPINEAQLIDQIQNGSLEFSPNSALEPQGENDCSGDSDTSDSTEVRNPSRDSSDGNVDEGSKPIPAISEQTVPEVSQFVEELPRSTERRRIKEEKNREMEERLALLKEKMKQSEVNQSGWFYYIGGAILALGLAGLYALYVRK